MISKGSQGAVAEPVGVCVCGNAFLENYTTELVKLKMMLHELCLLDSAPYSVVENTANLLAIPHVDVASCRGPDITSCEPFRIHFCNL